MAARMRPDDRRESIHRSALTVITRDGFQAATTRAIAEEAGITHSLLHRYFATRDELVATAFDIAASEEIERFAVEISAIDDLDDRLRWLCEPVDRPHYQLWIDAWGEASRNGALRSSLRRHHRSWRAATAALLAEGVSAGRWHCDDPDGTADRILAAFDGHAVQHYVFRHISAATHHELNLRAVRDLLGIADPPG